MHILFLTDNFPPEVNAPASRTFEHARAWVRLGHRVTVITCVPNFPKGEVYAGYRNRFRPQRETMEGIEVVRVWSYITANEGFLKRSLDYASFMVMAVPATIGVRDADVVVATSPQLFSPCAGALVSMMKRRPFVFELRDLWPESIRAVGAMRNERLFRMLEWLELALYRRAAHIVCVTESFRDTLVRRGVPAEKISVTTNGADLARFVPIPCDDALKAQLGLSGKFIAGYVGTHGMAHGLSTLLAAAERLAAAPGCANVHLLLLGDGAEKAKLKAEAARRNLTNVTFLDSVPRDEVPRYLSMLDVSIIHLRKTPLFETVIPSKLFECMAMGIPVLHGVTGESAEIVLRERVGIPFPPEDHARLAELVRELAGDPARRAALSRNGIEAARRYDRSQLAAGMADALATAALAARTRQSSRPQPQQSC